jgi:hypothetical protein
MSMLCNKCGIPAVIYKQINASGAVVVVERCPQCKSNPNKGVPFLNKSLYNVDTLPLFQDLTVNAEPCYIRGCSNKGTQLHHFAPKHLFDNYNDWPTAWLCQPHHDEWHKKTKTGSWRLYDKHS